MHHAIYKTHVKCGKVFLTLATVWCLQLPYIIAFVAHVWHVSGHSVWLLSHLYCVMTQN